MNLAQPAWLLLLILLPLLGTGAVLVSRLRRRQWQVFVADRLRPALLRSGGPLPRWLALGFLLAATGALIAALSRPQGDAGTETEKSTGRNILIALDLSRSMRVADVKPDRLTQAKVVIYELLEALPDERIGLVGFAGTAHLLAPLTIDHGAVREIVEQVDENWVELGGSDFTRALKLAISTLKETGQRNNALIVLSDGEKHDESIKPVIAEAKRAGIYILAVGFGTDDGDFVPAPADGGPRVMGPDGHRVLSRLQPETLRQLATETGGRFAVADGKTDIPAMVKLVAKDLDTFELAGRERPRVIEFYQWLVLPAIVFLMFSIIAGTRWRGVNVRAAAAAVALAAVCLPPPARAAEADELLRQGRHAEAREAFGDLAAAARSREQAARFSLGAGTAAYRAKDHTAARSAFSNALLSRDPAVAAHAHFGLGNTLFQIGWRILTDSPYPDNPGAAPDLAAFDAAVKSRLAGMLGAAAPAADEATPGSADLERLIVNWADAVTHYDSALRLTPDDPDLRHNRATAMAFLQRLMQLLEEESQTTEEAIPEPQPTPSPGTPGEQDSDSPGQQPDEPNQPDQPGGNEQKDPEKQGDQSDKSDQSDQSDPSDPSDKSDKSDKSDQSEDPSPQDSPKPGETPEEAARRILGEHADLQKGPPRKGHHIQRTPAKDW